MTVVGTGREAGETGETAETGELGEGTVDPILDAARDVILQVGIRRTTATGVARRAGVSRMTLYRRFQDVESLLVSLLTREIDRLLAETETRVARLGTARERLVTAAVTGVERLAGDPLFARLVEVDPEIVLPYLLERSGSSQVAVRRYLTRLLTAGQADGSIRPLDTDAAARVLQIMLQSFVLSARIVGAESDPVAVRRELTVMLDRYLTSGAAGPGDVTGGSGPEGAAERSGSPPRGPTARAGGRP